MQLKNVLIVVLISVTAVAVAFAQSVPPPPPPSQPTPSPQSAVHVTTRIVQVSVTVHDDRGRPVSGLTKDDFVLLDQGHPQQISTFSEQKNIVTTTRASAPNIFTNKFQMGDSQPPLTVIVLDTYNGGYWDSKLCPPPGPPPPFPTCVVEPMFTAVKEFVSHMQPQDRVALYELADTLYLLQDFTSDPDAILRGLGNGKKHLNRYYPPSATDTIVMSNFTMDAMTVISRRLAFVPGRKNLIWLSNGFPYKRIITDEKVDKSAKILANADLPLDAVDARGLLAPDGGGGGPVPHGASRFPAPTSGSRPSAGNIGIYGGPVGGFNAIRNLSDMSGGHPIYGTNDLAGAIRRVIDDSADTYILGYYPDHNKWNGEFREIKVKVNRPGVEVRSRKGYYAFAETTPSAAQKDATKLTDAIKSPMESTDLAFDVQADGLIVDGARQLKVKVTLDANQLRFQQKNDRSIDNITEHWAQFNYEGEQVGMSSQTINLKPSQDGYKQLLKDGFSFSEAVPVAKDASEVRLVLRDVGNGAIGSVIIPVARLFPSSAPTEAKQ